MAPDRELPHDLDAEQNLLAAMMLTKAALEVGADTVIAEDFSVQSHALVFAALVDLWRNGEPADTTSVADVLRRQGLLEKVDFRAIAEWRTNLPASSNVGRYAAIVVEHAARRTIIRIAENAASSAYLLTDPAALVDSVSAELHGVDLPTARVPADLYTLEQFRKLPEDMSPWVIPGLLRRGWRAVTVAVEGAGKTLIAQQVAMCAAAGLHPFTGAEMDPVTVLMIDLENDAERIRNGSDLVDAPLTLRRRRDGGVWLWHRPGGIDLRKRADRSTLEAVLAHCRPQLVCLGPLYKAYTSKASESHELVAAEVQTVLDDLRTRFKFAVLLEHHAPQGESKNVRDMRPYGSSLWLRWPEFGLALKRAEKPEGALLVGRWRGDRVKADWPDRLDRAKPPDLPWTGWWKEGTA